MAITSPIQNTVSTLNGLFKERYSNKVQNLIPDNVCVLNMVDFVGADKALGSLYHQPVVLGSEHGMTYGGSAGTAFSLNDAIAGQVKDATVQGYEFMLRTQISVAVASRSAKSEAAFERGTKLVVANMIRSFAKRLEACLLYGQKELAKPTGAMSGAVLTIHKDHWAPGIWVGAEKGIVDIYSSDLVTLRGTGQINAVNLETREITLDANIASVVSTDRIFWKGAKGNEFKGLHAIMTEATDLFGISPTAYSLFKSVEYSAASGQLSFSKIQSAIARAVEKGLDEDVVCLVNPRTWAKLLTDQAALRLYDSSYSTSKAENGSQNIKFYAQNGVVEVRPCTYMKESLAMIIPPKELMRIGSTDVTFELPGLDGQHDGFFLPLQSASGYELRAYSDQALFCSAPAKLVLIFGIDNDA